MTLNITKLSDALGAEVSGVDLRNIGPDLAEQLRCAWLEHHVLLFRSSVLTEDELVAFGGCFGHVLKARAGSLLRTRPEIMVVTNIRVDGKLAGSLPDGEMEWHYDAIHQAEPYKTMVLHAVEVPRRGGETRLANMCLAYESLPDVMKVKIAALTAKSGYNYDVGGRSAQTLQETRARAKDSPSAIHPVVRVLPETGKKAIYISRLMTESIVELPEAEGQQILAELYEHMNQTKFVYEHPWQVGDIVLWDNRCIIHARNDFSADERRLLKRISIR